MAKEMSAITDLVGREKNDPHVAEFMNALGVCADTDTFGGLSISDYPKHGLCLYFDEEEVLVTAYLYAEGHDGHSQFRGAMPHEAAFTSMRADVLWQFGEPERSGPTWDRFSFGTHLVHFQYATDEVILMITVMAPQMKEDRPNQTVHPTTL
ncbi:MAG: hypothetical protein IPL39_23895 [Opitutaceae bacterium]|nr:hypothetical protein [Opitutaceae bacterium]